MTESSRRNLVCLRVERCEDRTVPAAWTPIPDDAVVVAPEDGGVPKIHLADPVTGKTIKFSIKVDAQGTPLTIVYDGEIESNTAMKGKVDLGGVGTGTFTGKRTK